MWQLATIDTNGGTTYEFITPAAFDGWILDDALIKLLLPPDEESYAPQDNDDSRILSTTSKCLHTQRVCVTCGKDGAALWCENER